ncbi:hypothetical protein RCL1_008673 [Eukaryota sp. TZLM3-RCL]
MQAMYGPIISKLLIRDPASRATAADLLLNPKIIEVYEDFIKETRIEDVVNLRIDLRNLKKIVEDQSNLIGVVNSELLKGSEKNLELEEKILSQSLEINTLKSTVEDQNIKISSQTSEISTLKSTVSSLQSNLNQASLLSSDQSNLIHQFKQFLPLIAQLQAAEERRVEEERRAEKQRICLEVQKMERRYGRRFPDSVRRLAYECVKVIGRQVKRGRDWNGGNQDGGAGNVGVVTHLHPDSPGFVLVEWSNGNTCWYRWDCEGKCELELVD